MKPSALHDEYAQWKQNPTRIISLPQEERKD